MNKRDALTKAVIDDVITINQSVPVTKFPLKVALGGERVVKLKDGSDHLMDADELEEMANLLPSWMKWVVRVPLVVAYEPFNGVVRVLGNEWEEKAVRILVGVEKDEPLRLYHLERLIFKFPSLVFVIFNVNVSDVISGGSHDLEEGFV